MTRSQQALLILTMVSFVGCKSKKVNEDADTANGGLTSSISSEALNYSPQGSDTGKIDGLTTIHFDYDQASIGKTALEQLKQNAVWIKNHPNSKIQIEGHCDKRGSTEYNLALGERRAKAVLRTLTGMGIKKSQVTTISYGEERPIDAADNDEAYAKNRRANFVPLSTPGQPLAGY
jgi:peptidoglycan-associated lipoprotein